MTPFQNAKPRDFDEAAIKDVSLEDAAKAVARAAQAAKDWGRTSVEHRAGLLLKIAEILRRDRSALTALVLLEVHKNWTEADGDVCEAIDFLEYYAREALRIAGKGAVQPVGVVAVIAPWNFPLAILAGMTSAALVTGNTVLMKPAEQSPLIAWRFFEILSEAGIPEDVVQFLPGRGEIIGDFLVRAPEVALVAFTGSKEVGMKIAASKKRVIAEMGGKNAIIVDETADLEKATEGALLSAFGFQGQKCSACSRVIVLPNVYREFRERLVEAAKKISVGDPRDPSHFMGPVIDGEAEAKIHGFLELGRKEGKLLFEGNAPKEPGYVPPVIFEDVSPAARIAREEIFGPVVCLMRAADLTEAIRIANGVPYDLTGGLFSRDPAAIQRAREEFEVGNLYINRKITGALVACQPFGGYRVSSLGFKAGGPEYLQQFLKTTAATEPLARRELPSVTPDEKNELVYRREGSRLLGKTICEKRI